MSGVDAIWDVDTLADGAIATFADSVSALDLVALSAGQAVVGLTTRNGHKVARWDGRAGGGLQVGDKSRFTYFHEPAGIGWLLVVGAISLDSPSCQLFSTVLGASSGPGWHLEYLTHDQPRTTGFWSRAFNVDGPATEGRVYRAPHFAYLSPVGWGAALVQCDMAARHTSNSGDMSFNNDGHAVSVAETYGGFVGTPRFCQDTDGPADPVSGVCSGGFAVGYGLGGDLAYWAVGEGPLTTDEARGMLAWASDRFAL